MRFFTLLISIMFLWMGCQSDQTQPIAETTVTGYFDNVPGWEIILAQQTPEGNFPIDTAVVQEDGYFEFDPKIEELQLYRVVISPTQFITIAMQKGDHIHMEANGANVEGYYIEGSEESILISEVAREFTRHNAQMDSLRVEITHLTAEKNGKKLMEAFEFQRGLYDNQRQFHLDFAKKHPSSLAAYFVVSSLQPQEDMHAYKLVYQELEKSHPTFLYLPLLKEQIEIFNLATVGSEAPDLFFPNPEGDSISLRSLRGGYVLVDFWASWCKPCRDQNPAVKSIYDKYSNRGFEIYGYSLDKEKSRWVSAITADEINWIQTSDLKGWEAQGSLDYGVQAIPATFLIDPHGTIIARDLNPNELDQHLDSLLRM